MSMAEKVELVVSRYNESIDWLADNDFDYVTNVTIYNKGPSDVSVRVRKRNSASSIFGKLESNSIVKLENIGRESHTFLHHIIANYEKLAHVTIFLPASCMSDSKEFKTRRVVNRVRESRDTVIFGKWYSDVRLDSRLRNFTIGEWKGTTAENVSILPDQGCAPSNIARPFGQWYDHFFKGLTVNVVSYNSIFAISKRHIHQHPVEYYQQLLEAVSHHSNPEDGHFMERAWVAVFHPLPDECLYTDRPSTSNVPSNTTVTHNSVKRKLSEEPSSSSAMQYALQAYRAAAKRKKRQVQPSRDNPEASVPPNNDNVKK